MLTSYSRGNKPHLNVTLNVLQNRIYSATIICYYWDNFVLELWGYLIASVIYMWDKRYHDATDTLQEQEYLRITINPGSTGEPLDHRYLRTTLCIKRKAPKPRDQEWRSWRIAHYLTMTIQLLSLWYFNYNQKALW